MTAQWQRKLITREQAAELAGAEPVTWVASEQGMILRHLAYADTACGQSCGVWAPGHLTTADDMTAAVLRHLVTAHDVSLNKPERERRNDGRRAHPAGHKLGEAGQHTAGDAPPSGGTGPAAGGPAPGTAGRHRRGPAGETGGDRA